MSTDFKTVLIKDSRLDISDSQTYAVVSGAANNTYQQFGTVSSSASALVFNVSIPSESIIVNREVLISSGLTFTLAIGNVPVGEQAFNLGVTDAMGCFPLNSLFTSLSASINNTNVSVNLQDILPSLVRMNNTRKMYKCNGGSPSMPDQAYLNYADAVNATNSPLASWNTQGNDSELAPRGSHPLDVSIEQQNNAGQYVSSSPICEAEGNRFVVTISGQFIEPLFLSPYIFGNPEYNQGGFVGVSAMNITANIDTTARRLFSTANDYTYNILLGTASNANPFKNTKLLMNFLTSQPTDLIPTKNVLPYYDFPRYLSMSDQQSAIISGQSSSINSQNIQLSQLPDYFIISVRIPMNQQTCKNSDSFFTINNISINLNNQSGLLSSATPRDLWKMSQDNHSSQSYAEFSGMQMVSNNQTGCGEIVYTTGSLLVLSPAQLSLPSFLSAGSVGNFNFQFSINVTNNYSDEQYPMGIQPEVCVICCNSGLFITQQGSSVINTGLLTKQLVLDAKEKSSEPIYSSELTRMVGGKMNQMTSSALRKMSKHLRPSKFGGSHSGGAISGGSHSGGASKLSKYV
jgi:hypothetical protein